jgi:hypothetical protein
VVPVATPGRAPRPLARPPCHDRRPHPAPSPLAEPGQQACRRGTPRPVPQPARPRRPFPSIALTNEDLHYYDQSPPLQRGVAASPLRGHSGRLHEESLPTAPRRTGIRQPEVNAMIFSPTTIDGHRNSWSSNIFARTAFPLL